MTRLRTPIIEAAIVAALFAASSTASYTAMQGFRARGIQPWFYQGNFEPAVMMACGRGFVSATTSTIPAPLVAFLQLERNDFDCSLLPATLPRTAVTWNAPWYYLYGATATVWRLTGISWTALDGLVSLFGGVVTVALYGLFRLVAVRWIAAAVTLMLTMSPANLSHLLSLRDYSKAPFVLVAILILAVLVIRPMRPARTIAVAAVYGALVGFGWGFRSDLTVMVPFGVFVVLLLLPGSLRTHATRNGLAAAVLLMVFFLVAWPALKGLRMGGCQFHYALLGLTTPRTNELAVVPSIYRFGDHFYDTFVDLKVGDYGDRMLGAPVPNLCSPEYDRASGQLFKRMGMTFPADLLVHAYASVLMILREGFPIPAVTNPAPPFVSSGFAVRIYRILSRVTTPMAALGPAVTAVAIAVAWGSSARLGIALTAFVLFLTGYPAIEFEQRHWFHLRFIPWWAGLMVAGQLLRHGRKPPPPGALIRATGGLVAVLTTLAIALFMVRLVQARTVASLITEYLSAATEELSTARDGAVVRVDWNAIDYGSQPNHRGSDLLAVRLDSTACSGTGPLWIKVRYAADVQTHDMSNDVSVPRPAAGAAPTQIFVPIFWQGYQDTTYLQFTALEVVGAPGACIGRVARVVDRQRLPLWIEMQVAADWANQRLYQAIRAPRSFKWMTARPLL